MSQSLKHKLILQKRSSRRSSKQTKTKWSFSQFVKERWFLFKTFWQRLKHRIHRNRGE